MREICSYFSGSSAFAPSGRISLALAKTSTPSACALGSIEVTWETGISMSREIGPRLGASLMCSLNHAKGRWCPVRGPVLPSDSEEPAGRSSSRTSAKASLASRIAHLESSKSAAAAAGLPEIPTRQPLSSVKGDPMLVASKTNSGVRGVLGDGACIWARCPSTSLKMFGGWAGWAISCIAPHMAVRVTFSSVLRKTPPADSACSPL